MSSTTSGQPKWGPVLSVVYDTISMASDFSPGIVGYGGRFYCFWVQKPSNLLAYCVLGRQVNDVWEVTNYFLTIQVPNDIPTREQPEVASNSPALVVFGGKIHMVFPDHEGHLIHMQLNLETAIWEKRDPVGAHSMASARLAVFQQQIFCAYTTDVAGTIEVQRWDRRRWLNTFPADGLQHSASSLAMFELNGVLNLYLVPISGDHIIYHYVYDSRTMFSWNLQKATVDEILMVGSGVTGGCVSNAGFLAYLADGQTITDGRVTITTKHLDPALPSQQFSAKMKLPIIDTGVAPVAPELCAVGNILMAIWNDGAGMSYTTRRVWKPIPYLSSWMSPLASQTPISHLTIPGTHDSAAVSLVPLVSTQYLDIGAQLRAGIRYIDLRAGFSNDINDKNFRGLPDDLIAYHGPYRLRHSLNPTSPDYITIREIFEQCYNFLNDTDSSQECILMQIKQDYPAKPNDALECLFADAMMDLINEHERFNPGRLIWRLDSTLPTLAEVRGRIQLIRRFRGVIQDITPSGLPMAPGINVSIGWPNNGSGEIYPSGFIFQDPGFRIVLQDKWDWPFDFAARANKFKLVKQGLEAAKKDKNPKRWHINFASATAVYALMDGTRIALGKEVQQPDDSGRPSPIDDYGVNKRLSDFFSKAPKGHYGTILMDYAELPGDLILGIIRTNEFPG